jgi:hypothetical protein
MSWYLQLVLFLGVDIALAEFGQVEQCALTEPEPGMGWQPAQTSPCGGALKQVDVC